MKKNIICGILLIAGAGKILASSEPYRGEENIAGFRHYFVKAGFGIPANYNLSIGLMDFGKSKNVGWGASIECWGLKEIGNITDTLSVWPNINNIYPNFCLSGYIYISPYSNLTNLQGEKNLKGDLLPLCYCYAGGSPLNCIQLNCLADSTIFAYAPFFDAGLGTAIIFSVVTLDVRAGLKWGFISENPYYEKTYFKSLYFNFNAGLCVGAEVTKNDPSLIPYRPYSK